MRPHFTEADLPQKPKKGEGASEIEEHALRVTGIAYHTLARQAAQGDRDPQKKGHARIGVTRLGGTRGSGSGFQS